MREKISTQKTARKRNCKHSPTAKKRYLIGKVQLNPAQKQPEKNALLLTL